MFLVALDLPNFTIGAARHDTSPLGAWLFGLRHRVYVVSEGGLLLEQIYAPQVEIRRIQAKDG